MTLFARTTVLFSLLVIYSHIVVIMLMTTIVV